MFVCVQDSTSAKGIADDNYDYYYYHKKCQMIIASVKMLWGTLHSCECDQH